jgi:hypothetical protein
VSFLHSGTLYFVVAIVVFFLALRLFLYLFVRSVRRRAGLPDRNGFFRNSQYYDGQPGPNQPGRGHHGGHHGGGFGGHHGGFGGGGGHGGGGHGGHGGGGGGGDGGGGGGGGGHHG